MRPIGQIGKGTNMQGVALTAPLDAELGLLHLLLEGRASEVGEPVLYSHDHSPSTGLSSGA